MNKIKGQRFNLDTSKPFGSVERTNMCRECLWKNYVFGIRAVQLWNFSALRPANWQLFVEQLICPVKSTFDPGTTVFTIEKIRCQQQEISRMITKKGMDKFEEEMGDLQSETISIDMVGGRRHSWSWYHGVHAFKKNSLSAPRNFLGWMNDNKKGNGQNEGWATLQSETISSFISIDCLFRQQHFWSELKDIRQTGSAALSHHDDPVLTWCPTICMSPGISSTFYQ